MGLTGIWHLGFTAAKQEIGADSVKVGHIFKAVYGWGFPLPLPGAERRLGNAESFGSFDNL